MTDPDPRPISRPRLVVGLGTGIVAISCASIFIRLAQAQGMPALSIAAWRLVFACAVLLPWALTQYRDEILAIPRRELGLLAVSGVFLGLHFATWIASLDYTSVASSVVLVSLGPVFVGIGSWLLLGERPGMGTILGLGLATAGSIVIGWGDLGHGGNHLLGDVLALAGAAFVAGYLMIGRRARGHLSLTTYVAVVYGVAMVTLLVLVQVWGQPMLGFTPAAYGWAAALGLVPQLVGHSTLNWALRYLSATMVAIVTLAEPIGSSLLAYFLLHESITPSTALGGVLVLTGIVLASRAEGTVKAADDRTRETPDPAP
jgi:drug/metabolite transporter (DMT)-like permease